MSKASNVWARAIQCRHQRRREANRKEAAQPSPPRFPSSLSESDRQEGDKTEFFFLTFLVRVPHRGQ